MAKEFQIALSVGATTSFSSKPHLLGRDAVTDTTLFRALGFTDCRSLDMSDYEGADFIYDLNSTDLPPSLVGAFDVILDGGTLEHVFHLPNALQNVHSMLRVGGRVIHMAPSSNYMDHGFYMFSPTLFWDYYTSNRYDINRLQIIRHLQDYDGVPWQISDYTPGCIDDVSFGGLDDAMYAIVCIATKRSDSTGCLVPQQRSFRDLWKAQAEAEQATSLPAPARQSLFQKVVTAIKRRPVLYQFLKPVVRAFRTTLNGTRAHARRRKGLGLRITEYY